MSEAHDELIASLFRPVRAAIGEDDIEAARRAVNKFYDALDGINPPEARDAIKAEFDRRVAEAVKAQWGATLKELRKGRAGEAGRQAPVEPPDRIP